MLTVKKLIETLNCTLIEADEVRNVVLAKKTDDRQDSYITWKIGKDSETLMWSAYHGHYDMTLANAIEDYLER
tara:strand:- start:289 stop:507 length:219 start_codon:yes stop_codon:yes gene_type:complete